jgi:hypothetical protein
MTYIDIVGARNGSLGQSDRARGAADNQFGIQLSAGNRVGKSKQEGRQPILAKYLAAQDE